MYVFRNNNKFRLQEKKASSPTENSSNMQFLHSFGTVLAWLGPAPVSQAGSGQLSLLNPDPIRIRIRNTVENVNMFEIKKNFCPREDALTYVHLQVPVLARTARPTLRLTGRTRS
jgi:hypothetical protein